MIHDQDNTSDFWYSKLPLSNGRKRYFPLSYQLKGKILEIYNLSSARSVMFIAQDDELSTLRHKF